MAMPKSVLLDVKRFDDAAEHADVRIAALMTCDSTYGMMKPSASSTANGEESAP